MRFKPLGVNPRGFFPLNQIYVLIDFSFKASYTVKSCTGIELMMYSTLCGYAQVKSAD